MWNTFEFFPVEKDNLLIGKYIAAEFVGNIWDSYIRDHIENNEWPKQCKDINTFLIKTDLAEIIGVESIRDRLLNFYNVISRRVAVLYQRDKNLQISSSGKTRLKEFKNTKVIFLGKTKLSSQEFFDEIRKHEVGLSTGGWTKKLEDKTLVSWGTDWIKKSKEFKVFCQENQIEFFDTSTNQPKVLQNILSKVEKKVF